jgi:DNA invertase Pin-like site-specific DNA recombinase
VSKKTPLFTSPNVTSEPGADNEPLPRPTRQRRRAKADRGLPPDEELKALAVEYLKAQRKHWPEVVKAGLLPDATDAVLGAMVEDFKDRHRDGAVEPESVRVFLKYVTKLAGDYSRYSCDNSNPTSIIDQMVNALDTARREGRFVPWAYVYADYSVSGLNPSRQGYASYKALLRDEKHLIETTYVDDFTRASRDEIEWWKLAYLSRRLKKRMVGASDGFDVSAANWDMMVSLYALLSRVFIKGLREKVKRGMKGAARRGTCVGKMPLGFTRRARRDRNGNAVRDKDGTPEYVPCVDPATCASRRLLYELYVEKCWSVYDITKHFNANRVDGWEGWTERGIRKLLWSATAVGTFIWNRTRREYDHEEQKWVVLPNPRSEWVIHHDPNLALVPVAMMAAARKKLTAARRESPLTGRRPSRNEKSATTLFSGTLYCGSCGRELTLLRSAGKYKVMGCINGPTGKHGCTLDTSKSTRIIEECLLGHLRERVLSEASVEALVTRANAFLAEEAAKPRVSAAPIRATIREKEAAIKKLFVRVEGSDNDALVEAYEKRIAELQKEVNDFKCRLREAEANNTPPPASLDLAAVKSWLSDLRGLLNQEIPAAAEVLRNLTGKITVTQKKETGKTRGATWVASFSPDFLGFLKRFAGDKAYPETVTLEYLSTRIWITREKVETRVDHVPKYARIAAEVRAMADAGASVNTIAAALGITWFAANDALKFATTGEVPQTRPPGKRTGTRSGTPKHIALAAEVARLRDEERLSFPEIAKHFDISMATARRSYDHAHRGDVLDAAAGGRKPSRGCFVRVGVEARREILRRLGGGEAAGAIAAAVGCSVRTVYRLRKEVGGTK